MTAPEGVKADAPLPVAVPPLLAFLEYEVSSALYGRPKLPMWIEAPLCRYFAWKTARKYRRYRRYTDSRKHPQK